ncbi:MAG: response regulator [Acidobacteriota bacterium]
MKRIALVEDNPDNRMLVHVILEDHYEIIEYESGAQALEGIRESRPDLVLLDISLPELDGTEVLHEIRSDSELSSLPVIALTAHAMTGDREKYLAAGFNEYVAKPIVDEGILLAAIQRCLTGRLGHSIFERNGPG